jgi:hypothetical protein
VKNKAFLAFSRFTAKPWVPHPRRVFVLAASPDFSPVVDCVMRSESGVCRGALFVLARGGMRMF